MKNRRGFLKGVTGAGVLTAASYRRVIGAGERVRVGFIGIGLIGKRHLLDFMAQPDVEVAAICETYEPRLREGIETAGNRPEGFRDFRRMYERKDIGAVCVSTPDHWHALQTILACAAGKDVYVEKPLTHVVAEGRWMIEAMKHYTRVVQVGTQRRSGEQYHKCVELIRSGHIGEVRSARITAYRNIMPGFTQPVGTEALSESDWRMWLGPAPDVPFDRHRCIYHFRWFWDYSGGQTTNLLSQDLDIVQWAMNAAPRAVAAFGGRYSLKGFGETPDVVEAVLDYPGFVLHWSCREITVAEGRGLEFQGTKGRIRINRAGIEVIPDRLIPADDQIPRLTEPPRVQSEVQYRTEAFKRAGYEQVRDQFRDSVEVVTKLAPYVVTTHLKDMALRPDADGFQLSEVPLGELVDTLRRARRDVHSCLEMITRDPLKVPYLTAHYWATRAQRDEARIEKFRAAVLSRAAAKPLPVTSGLSREQMLEAENSNVRRSLDYARRGLKL